MCKIRCRIKRTNQIKPSNYSGNFYNAQMYLNFYQTKKSFQMNTDNSKNKENKTDFYLMIGSKLSSEHNEGNSFDDLKGFN